MELLRMKNITKSFNHIQVLRGINFSVNEGEIVALLGENGAGKSTLMKILAGVHQPTSGQIILEGQEVEIQNPKHSQSLNISIIHQEFNLLKDLSVAENIFLGREWTKTKGLIDWKTMKKETAKLLGKVGLEFISPDQLISECSIAQRQLIEIAKALSFEAKILIMDEPSATLNNADTDKLLRLMESLKEQGMGIIFITHRLEEVTRVADRVVVLRDGEYIGSEYIENLTKEDMVSMMVGRDLSNLFPEKSKPQTEEVLEVNDLLVKGKLHHVSFRMKKGEVLGVAGLMGSGKTELSKALFGLYANKQGSVKMLGKEIVSPKGAIDAGIALVTDDRKDEGLILDLSVFENLLLPFYRRVSQGGVIKRKVTSSIADNWIKKLKIKTPGSDAEVGQLSGGNQQKVVLGKWLQMDPKLIILNEPTRGIDIGAKQEIYRIVHDLTEQGISVLLISSEMPELLGMANRILVMNEGEVAGELTGEEATQERIFKYASGGVTNA
ncbi:sugar ABC transporter ATP-binding protein [Halobacillus litoralis]|uniref:sugar ABC transporter ATP-binding protein n=1 Tax=Halobacillus litoralis TaxID=45668 RepID=UPI001CFDBC69|nr:sugar ABC transporter ATP-binding protein [Halobacillus litoralis]